MRANDKYVSKYKRKGHYGAVLQMQELHCYRKKDALDRVKVAWLEKRDHCICGGNFIFKPRVLQTNLAIQCQGGGEKVRKKMAICVAKKGGWV